MKQETIGHSSIQSKTHKTCRKHTFIS